MQQTLSVHISENKLDHAPKHCNSFQLLFKDIFASLQVIFMGKYNFLSSDFLLNGNVSAFTKEGGKQKRKKLFSKTGNIL